uniref:C2H2-type domain-containing protein n=1 Tax=Moniliophthora roreri TaxID=221103 RepID=A0A0W0G9Y1_MONRR
MLQFSCCPDICSFIDDPHQQHHNSVEWVTELEAFLCSCNKDHEHHAYYPNPAEVLSNAHFHFPPSYHSANTPMQSPMMSFDETQYTRYHHTSDPLSSLSPTSPFTTSSPFSPLTDDLSRLPSSASAPTTSIGSTSSLLVSCMWGNCQARFSTSEQLIEHVNTQHLTLPQLVPEQQQISCLWRDCHELFPDLVSTSGVHSDLGSLATHLLENHLNYSTTTPGSSQQENHSTVTFQDPFKEVLSFPRQDDTAQNVSEEASSRSVTPVNTDTEAGTSHPHHECSGSHTCHWEACGKTFNSCLELTEHLTAVHVGSGKPHYECLWKDCTRNGTNCFTSKQKICRHLQSHTGHRPFQCKVCHQNFSEAATLQQHMRRHTQEKPYVCDYPGCGKAFAITGALTIHKRTHNGHKPFKCTYCDRAFSESSNLSKHLRTHTGARPYICSEPDCKKSFARPDQLTRHMNVHKKKAITNRGNAG